MSAADVCSSRLDGCLAGCLRGVSCLPDEFGVGTCGLLSGCLEGCLEGCLDGCLRGVSCLPGDLGGGTVRRCMGGLLGSYMGGMGSRIRLGGFTMGLAWVHASCMKPQAVRAATNSFF